jgi:hypothetical protein
VTLTKTITRRDWNIDSRSRLFRRWLSKRYYKVTGGGVLTASELADLAALLEKKAGFHGLSTRSSAAPRSTAAGCTSKQGLPCR